MENKQQFTDSASNVWCPVLTTPAIIKTCRSCNITIATLTGLNVNVADLMEALWFACEYQAKERQVDHDKFLELISPDVIPQAVAALWEAVKTSFPQLKDVKLPSAGAAVGNPLDLSKFGI